MLQYKVTSFIDSENELDVQRALNDLVKDCTVIMIAHKLKTVAGAGRIPVLGRGEIIEQGTHSELLKKNRLYAHLWNVQQETSGY